MDRSLHDPLKMAAPLLATYLGKIGLSIAIFKNTTEFKIGGKNGCFAQKQASFAPDPDCLKVVIFGLLPYRPRSTPQAQALRQVRFGFTAGQRKYCALVGYLYTIFNRRLLSAAF